MYNPSKPYTEQILSLIKDTWRSPHANVYNGGPYPLVQPKFNSHLAAHTDGIGTKGMFHWKQRTFRNAVLDALAMNLNDLLLVRARPCFILDHIILPEDDKKAIVQIVEELSKECRQREIIIAGGETSIQNNLDGMDISISVIGYLKDKPKPNIFEPGDVLLGIQSDGLHSNGFTKVRELFPDSWKRTDFTCPTHFYTHQVEPMLGSINAMAHITGGAFTKLKFMLAGDAIIRKTTLRQPIFDEIYAKGVSDEEMYRTFNCGIGFIMGVAPEKVEILVKSWFKNCEIIGEVVPGSGNVSIESVFSDKKIVL